MTADMQFSLHQTPSFCPIGDKEVRDEGKQPESRRKKGAQAFVRKEKSDVKMWKSKKDAGNPKMRRRVQEEGNHKVYLAR